MSIPNEAGEEKLEKGSKKEPDAINYASLGILPPKGEVEYDEEGRIILDDEDLEEITVPLTIPLNNLGSYYGDVEGGSFFSTKDGSIYSVIEEVHEIDAYLEVIEMSWLEKNWIYLKNICRIKK